VTAWEEWASGVLNGLGAPESTAAVDALWAWSNAETAPYDLMRWNNPLDTTERWTGSSSANSAGVQRYLTVQDGAAATVATLLNGYYPVIVAHLVGGVPRQQWGDACTELSRWGTGCGWLAFTYGPAPSDIGGDMTPEEHGWLSAVFMATTQSFTLQRCMQQLTQMETDLKAAIAASPGGGGGLTAAQVAALTEIHDAVVRIENALKAA
jgi:hypothetical protein